MSKNETIRHTNQNRYQVVVQLERWNDMVNSRYFTSKEEIRQNTSKNKHYSIQCLNFFNAPLAQNGNLKEKIKEFCLRRKKQLAPSFFFFYLVLKCFPKHIFRKSPNHNKGSPNQANWLSEYWIQNLLTITKKCSIINKYEWSKGKEDKKGVVCLLIAPTIKSLLMKSRKSVTLSTTTTLKW